MKYFDYFIFILGLVNLIISLYGNSITHYLCLGFGLTMMIYSGMNIYKKKFN
tara:strand:- start:3773 stop:3928 length:156 start_codon:yes stop_codon:yes gene_type:complete